MCEVGRWLDFKNLVPAHQVSRLDRSVAAPRSLQLHHTRLLWKEEPGNSWFLTAGEAAREDRSSGSQTAANWACWFLALKDFKMLKTPDSR